MPSSSIGTWKVRGPNEKSGGFGEGYRETALQFFPGSTGSSLLPRCVAALVRQVMLAKSSFLLEQVHPGSNSCGGVRKRFS